MTKLMIVLVVAALGLSAFAAFGTATLLLRNDGPQGVCVNADPYGLGTDGTGPHAVVLAVEQAKRVNGVVTCEVGAYVPVTPS